ncbi:MAG: magnesium transporter [Hyphomicrobiaceae bacterium]
MPEAEQHNTAKTADADPSQLAANVAEALSSNDAGRLHALVSDLRPPDLADVIELLEPDQRVQLIQQLGADFNFEVLSELDPAVRDQLSEALPNELLARAVTELDSDDAAYVIESLEKADKDEILAQIPRDERAALERNLEYPEETAGRLMQAEFVAVAPFWNVGQVIDYMRESEDLPQTFSEIFVVDPAFKVLGAVDLSRLLRTKRQVRVEEIMEPVREVVLATDDQEKVARQFQRYDLMSAPVVDQNNRMVGVVTVDDVVEVIQEEAEEDIRALGGVGDESVVDPLKAVLPSRFTWLCVNLVNSLISCWVISQFDATLQQMVTLAALMPIVASMGGNAATQTMTISVRALALQVLGPMNLTRFVLRETAVGLLNGLMFAVILGAIVVLWFGVGKLGLVIGAAIICNMLAAALAGILVPLLLHRRGYDPAVSSTVFVTTITDVVGFFSFLGLATIWLL